MKQEIAKIPDWPRRKAFAEVRLCVGHNSLGTHLYHIGICPDPYCTLCSLREPTDRNHLGQCTAPFDRTECEQYWEARTKIMENWLLFLFYYYRLWLLLMNSTFILTLNVFFFNIYSVILTFNLYWLQRAMDKQSVYLPLGNNNIQNNQ
jgi:hypothetical protein